MDAPGQNRSDLFFSLSSLSEKSERDLPASERENSWRFAYRSSTAAASLHPRLVLTGTISTVSTGLSFWTESLTDQMHVHPINSVNYTESSSQRQKVFLRI